MHDLPHREVPDGALGDVAVSLAADAEQIGEPGLRATLRLRNHGASSVHLLNPYDLLQLQLFDASQAPLTVPSKPPNLTGHLPRSEPWRLMSPVRIVHVETNGATVDASELDTPVITLDAGGEQAVTYELDEIIEDGVTVEPRAGRYAIGAMATLIDALEPESSRIVSSRPIDVGFAR